MVVAVTDVSPLPLVTVILCNPSPGSSKVNVSLPSTPKQAVTSVPPFDTLVNPLLPPNAHCIEVPAEVACDSVLDIAPLLPSPFCAFTAK